MKKLVIISMTASPHQVRFVPYLAQYFDVQHYFYSRLGGRQDFWKVDLGSRCHILPCWFKWRAKYLTFAIWAVLRKERPDILLLGGFSVPSNYLAYLWARKHNVPVVVFTERSRNKRGELRRYDIAWRLIRFLYRNVTRVMTSAEDIVPQFRDTFHFGGKVVAARYPTDIDRYFLHPPRMPKESYTLIYPNRMTDIYNPIEAVEIFAEVLKRHPATKLKMNASGELRPQVERRIDELGIRGSIDFLDGIKSWDDLGSVYASCDIMYLPAKFSNGNYTIWECRASGMGCIISDKVLGEFADEMRKANVGFVVPLSREAFVEKICWYIEHPEVFVKEAKINRDQLRYLTHEETAKMYNQILKAVAKLFFEYCFDHGIDLPEQNFTAEYRTNIPRLVGLSGSSAICSAMLKALMKFYSVDIPLEYTPTICLEAEKLELGINCGFQDRVIQMYNGLVFMDFEKAFVEENKRGRYERLDPKLLPNVYVAFDPNRAEESGKAHKKVKRLFEEKKADILAAMTEFADIAQKGRDALVEGRVDIIPALVNANFDLRDKIFNVAELNRNMVMTARESGASAKFAGSGGAIVGTYEDDAQYEKLKTKLASIGCTTFKPIIAISDDDFVVANGAWRNS